MTVRIVILHMHTDKNMQRFIRRLVLLFQIMCTVELSAPPLLFVCQECHNNNNTTAPGTPHTLPHTAPDSADPPGCHQLPLTGVTHTTPGAPLLLHPRSSSPLTPLPGCGGGCHVVQLLLFRRIRKDNVMIST